jgi:hypothetical protein
MRGPCSIEGCEKPIDGRGYCKSHYRRWQRHGDPLGGGITKGETLRYIQTTVLSYEGDDCLIWPYGYDGSGYGSAHYEGRHIRAHRLVCTLAYGKPDDPELQAAHTCGKGDQGCVNKNHLRWATRVENANDRYAHGTMSLGEHSWKAKLTADQVLDIRQLAGAGIPYTEIARRFGVSDGHIGKIVAYQKWSWLSDERDRLRGIARLHEKMKAENERMDREGSE